MANIRLRRLPTTEDELWLAVYALFGVKIPRTQVCPDHVAPFVAFADAYFSRNSLRPGKPRSGMGIWHASRGLAGKSKTLSILGLTNAYLRGADITILGGSMAQSVNVHEYMRSAMEREELQGMVLDQTSMKIMLTNKGRVRPLTASQRTVRGPHPSMLLMDEVDEMDLAIYDAALGQPMPQPNYLGETVETYTVVSSTWQNPDGTFTEILQRAEERDTQVYQWCVTPDVIVATARGGVRLDELRGDDLILTRSGLRPLQHVTYMGEKATVLVRLDDGRQLSCTPDHRIATPGGWVEAGGLGPADRVVVTKAGSAVPATVRPLVEVGAAVGVVARAVGQGKLTTHDLASAHIGRDLGGFQVGRVAAGMDLAEMVNSPAGRNVDTGQADRQPVRELLTPGVDGQGPRHLAVAARVAGLLPDPTASRADDDALPDVVETHVASVCSGATTSVYDIGVEGAHEFFANGILVHNCYLESSNPVDGWLTEQTIQDKKDSVSLEMFRIEYDLGEPSIGNRAFDGDAVEKAFCLKFKPDDEIGVGAGYTGHKVSKDFEEYTFAPYLKHGTYVACADWGKEQDKTVIWVARVDEEQRELVYYLRVNRRPYPQMIGWYNDVINRYNVPDTGAWHDSTGLGNVVNDYVDVRAHAFSMTGDKRTKMLSDYVNAIEKGSWKMPRIKSAHLEMKRTRYGDLYSNTKDFHLPDSVCAGALAEYAAKRAAPSVGPVMIKRDGRPTKLGSLFVAGQDDHELSPVSADEPEPGFSFVT